MASGSVAEVKSRLAVADVVGETVQLKKAGSTFKGLCPFHGEKTPSFVVTPARDSWKCFGCGKGGDIFTFVMERDNLPFGEALTLLAAKAGVVLDERSRAEDVRRARLREVLEGAVSFYSPPIVAAVAVRMIASALASSSPSATRAARSRDLGVDYSPLTTRAAIMDRSI